MNPLQSPPDRPKNDRPGEVTTIYATGEVVRVKPSNAQQQRPSVPAIIHEPPRENP